MKNFTKKIRRKSILVLLVLLSVFFVLCKKLSGGQGTSYDSVHMDKAYARIDGGTENPGYFTDIADKP